MSMITYRNIRHRVRQSMFLKLNLSDHLFLRYNFFLFGIVQKCKVPSTMMHAMMSSKLVTGPDLRYSGNIVGYPYFPDFSKSYLDFSRNFKTSRPTILAASVSANGEDIIT